MKVTPKFISEFEKMNFSYGKIYNVYTPDGGDRGLYVHADSSNPLVISRPHIYLNNERPHFTTWIIVDNSLPAIEIEKLSACKASNKDNNLFGTICIASILFFGFIVMFSSLGGGG